MSKVVQIAEGRRGNDSALRIRAALDHETVIHAKFDRRAVALRSVRKKRALDIAAVSSIVLSLIFMFAFCLALS